jgi:hypothetical protein
MINEKIVGEFLGTRVITNYNIYTKETTFTKDLLFYNNVDLGNDQLLVSSIPSDTFVTTYLLFFNDTENGVFSNSFPISFDKLVLDKNNNLTHYWSSKIDAFGNLQNAKTILERKN